MRAEFVSRIESVPVGADAYRYLGWRQAGLVSFAYRLAHLQLSRLALVGTLSLLFLLS
jgi:hypothetical protein